MGPKFEVLERVSALLGGVEVLDGKAPLLCGRPTRLSATRAACRSKCQDMPTRTVQGQQMMLPCSQDLPLAFISLGLLQVRC